MNMQRKEGKSITELPVAWFWAAVSEEVFGKSSY